LIPAQLRFRFLMILLYPVATVGILDQHRQGRRGGEVTPEIFLVSLGPPARTLADQPADMTGSIAIDPPTT
jgi:hypothetical protein